MPQNCARQGPRCTRCGAAVKQWTASATPRSTPPARRGQKWRTQGRARRRGCPGRQSIEPPPGNWPVSGPAVLPAAREFPLRDLKLHLRFSSRLFSLLDGVLAVAVAATTIAYRLNRLRRRRLPNLLFSRSCTAKPESDNRKKNAGQRFRLEGPGQVDGQNNRAPARWLRAASRLSTFSSSLSASAFALSLSAEVLRNRAEKVRSDIESARKVTETQMPFGRCRAKLSKLDEEIQKFRAKWKRRACRTRPGSRRRWLKRARALSSPPSRRLARLQRRRGADCVISPRIWPLTRR